MANIQRFTYPIDSRQGKILNRVLTRRELSGTRFGGQNRLFRELQRQYFALADPLEGRTPDQPVPMGDDDDQPNVFVPIPFTLVEQAVPTWMFQVFGDTPPVKVYGRTEEDHKLAENQQDLLAYDFQQARVFQRSIPIAKQLFKFGTGIFEVGWRYDRFEREEVWSRQVESGLGDDGRILYETEKEKVKRPVTRYDGPWLIPRSVTHSYPDPMFCEINEMRFFIVEEYADRRRLKWEDEMHRKLTGEPLYRDLDKIPPLPTVQIEELLEGGAGPEEEVAVAMGWTGLTRVRDRYTAVGRREDPENEVVKITSYWSMDEVDTTPDRLVKVANGSTVIRDGPNPWEDKELPFGAVRCFPIEGQFWGIGLLHPVRDLVYAYNDWRNYMMQNAKYNALRVWAISEDIDVPPNADRFVPGDVLQVPFHANGRPMAADLFQGRALPPEAYQYEDRLVMDIQRAVGSNAMIEPTADTATEAQLQRAGTAIRERLMGATGELDYLVRIAQLFISRRQQFFDEMMQIRILGPKGQPTFKKLSAQDIAGQFDYMAEGTSIHPNRAVIRQQLLEAIALTNNNPVLMSITDMYEFWSELLKSFDFRNYKRLLNPPTDKTFDPIKIENPLLLAGVEVPVEPSEPHELHLQAHQQALVVAIQKGAEVAEEAIRNHLAEHQKYYAMAQGAGAATPPQEQPGGVRGMTGNVPSRPGAPSEASMMETMGDTGGGQ